MVDDVVGGFINDVLYYLGIGEVGPEYRWSPGLGLMVMSLHIQNNTLRTQSSCIQGSIFVKVFARA